MGGRHETLLFSPSLGCGFTKLAAENLEPALPEVQARTGAELSVVRPVPDSSCQNFSREDAAMGTAGLYQGDL